MTNRKDEVSMQWTANGKEWRVLNCWVGNGYRSFTQYKDEQSGIWFSWD
jgi:hypothetical protein